MSLSLLWFLLGLVFLVVELLAPNLVLIFFGAGAWVTAVLALTDLSLTWQMLCFALISLLTLLLLRRHLKKIFRGHSSQAAEQDSTSPAHPLSQRLGVVSKALGPGIVGEICIDGSFWRATAAESLPEGTTVRVLGTEKQDALTLLVQRADAA